MTPRRAAAYLRVSSEKQADEDRFGYHRQIEAIRGYAERSSFELVNEYRDAITGKSVTRVGLDQLIREAGQFDAVIISSVDRLARDVTASYAVLANLLASGVRLHSADQGIIDLNQEASLIQFNLQALFAHLERQKIVSRTLAARYAIAEAGGIPTGTAAYGYRRNGRAWVIHPGEAKVIRDMYSRLAAGETLYGVAAALRAAEVSRPSGEDARWRYSDVRQIVTRTAYRGEYQWGRFAIPIPAIVTTEEWSAGQPRGRGRPRKPSGMPLIGHLRCGTCGRRMTSNVTNTPNRTYSNYRCSSHTIPNARCGGPSIVGSYLDPLVEERLRQALTSKRELRRMLHAAEERSDETHKGLLALDTEDKRWLDAFKLGAITAVELSRYRDELRSKRAALAPPRPRERHAVDEYVKAASRLSFRELLEYADVEVVFYSRDRVEIRLNARSRA